MGHVGGNVRERIIDAAEPVLSNAGAGHMNFHTVMSHAGFDLPDDDFSEDIR